MWVRSGILMPVFLMVAVTCLWAAQEEICSVFSAQDQTIYKVPKVETSNCEHQWINATDFVLANSYGKDASVLLNNLTTLVTPRCLDVVHYKRDCDLEETPFKCSCFVNCTVLNIIINNVNTASNNHMVAFYIVGIVVGLILMIILLVGVIVIAHLKRRAQAEDLIL